MKSHGGSVFRRDPFPSTIPEAFGFNSHYWDFAEGGNQGALETWSLEKWEAPWGRLDPMADMGRSGFPIHRSTVAWNVNEPSPGTYNWALQDALMKENVHCGLRALLFLAYGHPKYDASSGPSETCKVYSVLTREGRDGYAGWARQVARRYRGKQVIYELWNEPNIHIFWPKPDPDAYMALVAAAAPAIRAEDPTALIAGGALSNVWGGKWDELDVPYLTREKKIRPCSSASAPGCSRWRCLHFSFSTSSPIARMSLRLGPFGLDETIGRALVDGETVVCAGERSGDSQWVWINNLENVTELELKLYLEG